MPNRQLVAKSNPAALEQIATELRNIVADHTEPLKTRFRVFREGQAGKQVRSITENLFGHWCAESGTPPIHRIVDEVASMVKVKTADAARLTSLFIDRGFPTSDCGHTADQIAALIRQGKATQENLTDTCWPLYAEAISKMCAQSAHVIAARLLLYRIGEDTGIFATRISGNALSSVLNPPKGTIKAQTPILGLLEAVRCSMESFLPHIYRLGELDWWIIPADKRSAMNASAQAIAGTLDKDLDVVLERAVRALDRYQFADIDVDIWRNVYQHYLPSEERQRLGGFYTADELIDLILDEIGYVPDDPDLARKTFIDPACGSGAFVVAAVSRLLQHFQKFGPPDLPDGRQPQWVRAEYELRAVQACLHAVDMHPFAAFLTTLNTLFLLLSRYKVVKDKNPDYVFEPSILAHDSLVLTPEEAKFVFDLKEQVNGRVRRAVEDRKRYAKLLRKDFDFVFGNPPWSGILKGPLAAVYDEIQKKRMKDAFPVAATGKYDIYGLFMERSLLFLKSGGKFGLVTQDTYLEKQWAGNLRRKLSHNTTIQTFIDLNPCGQLFFKAMNTPAITVVVKAEPPEDHKILVAKVEKPTGKKLDDANRRRIIFEQVTSVLKEVRTSGAGKEQFVEGFTLPQAIVAAAGRGRWHIAPPSALPLPGRLVGGVKAASGWISVGELLEPFQGVTPGGKGCLDIFVLDETTARSFGIEQQFVHPVVKGRDVERFRCRKTGLVVIYPYRFDGGRARPAFDLASWKARQKRLLPKIRPLEDALDFNQILDRQEADYRRGKTLDVDVLRKLVAHRVAIGLIQYPGLASYLVGHYETLEARIFKKKNIREFGRRWYEFIWPRDSNVMRQPPKLIAPRLTRYVRFGFDRVGIVPQDSCIALVPTNSTTIAWRRFRKQLSEVAKRRIADSTVFKVILAFANSAYAQRLLTTGRRPTPKGSYQITDDFLNAIAIPPLDSAKTLNNLTAAVDVLCSATAAAPDPDIDRVIERLLRKQMR